MVNEHGTAGMQYEKPSFSVSMGGGDKGKTYEETLQGDIADLKIRLDAANEILERGNITLEIEAKEKELAEFVADREKLRKERKDKEEEIKRKTKEHLQNIANQKVTRKLVPFGKRILVKRRHVEDKSEHIILPDEVKGLSTDIADVVAVPERTFADTRILQSADNIVKSLTAKAETGDAAAMEALLKFNEYLTVMSVKVGDVLLMSRYGGTDFLIQETNQSLCVTDTNGIYALVIEIKKGQ